MFDLYGIKMVIFALCRSYIDYGIRKDTGREPALLSALGS